MSTSTADLFGALTQQDEATTRRLHDRLVAGAAAAKLLDVTYRTVESPVGRLLLAATPAGLVRVAYEAQDHDAVLDDLARLVSPRLLRTGSRFEQAARQLDEYFAGERTAFDVPLDLQLAQGFRRSVVEQLRAIGYGSTLTYGQVAAQAGSPRAARAVGSACRTNPLPVVVPCHRVVRGDGEPGDYVGGSEAKLALLRLEAGAR